MSQEINNKVSRRDVIKAAGVVSLGLLYTKPFVEPIHAKPAFAAYSGTKGNNGVGNGEDPQPPGNPPINDGPGTSPGNPGNQGGANK
ncbi:MAG: hypothetical protein HS126_19360 [Anaerolineales bacterium]|nr:hypothetical protein [Anaerolineales bacterium]